MPSPQHAAETLDVGIFIARWPTAHLGGAELQAARTARELAARGHRVHVFTRRDRTAAPHEPWPGVTLHPRGVAPVPGLRLAGEIMYAARQARRVRTDVNLCYITLNSGVLGYTARRVQRTPFVLWLRGLAESSPRPRTLRTRLERFVRERADRVWVQSTGLVARMQTEYEAVGLHAAWQRLASRVRVVGNGVDLQADASERAVPPQRVLFVGRLVEEKSLGDLIDAARRVPELEVQLVGDGPLLPELRERAQGSGVTFLGRRPPAAIADLLRDSRGLVLSSRSEGLPNVVLEALAHGRPVVATPVGAIPELVEDGMNGRLVPVGDPDALAAALRELIDTPRWRALAAGARRSVQRYAWPQLVLDIERELLETVHAERAGCTRASAVTTT